MFLNISIIFLNSSLLGKSVDNKNFSSLFCSFLLNIKELIPPPVLGCCSLSFIIVSNILIFLSNKSVKLDISCNSCICLSLIVVLVIKSSIF